MCIAWMPHARNWCAPLAAESACQTFVSFVQLHLLAKLLPCHME